MPTILITGAGRGLGLELARQSAEDGWRVIGTVRDDAGAARLKKLGAETLRLDVAAPAQARKALSLKDPIDILFCNAGTIGKRGAALGSFDYADWEDLLRVNLLAKGLAASLAPRGIILVAVSPGWVRTDMGGAGAPLSPEDSVRGLRKVLGGLRPQDSGRFFSHDGSAIPW